MNWTPGRWLGGVSRSLTWTARTLTTGQYGPAAVLDWAKLYNALEDAITFKYSFQTKTETICRYNTLLTSLDALTCDCAGAGRSVKQIWATISKISDLLVSTSHSSCFNSVDNPNVVGNNVVCPRANTTVQADPGYFNFGDKSVSATQCVRISPSIVSALTYQNLQTAKLSSFLIDFTEKTQVRLYPPPPPPRPASPVEPN